MRGILYVNVADLTYQERESRVSEAEASMKTAFPDIQLAVLRVYDGTPTHFMQLDDNPPTLFG